LKTMAHAIALRAARRAELEFAKQEAECYHMTSFRAAFRFSNRPRALNEPGAFCFGGISMDEKVPVSLRDGTLVRHKIIGYEGKVEGTTAIKACFTKGGTLQEVAASKETFQYRVAVAGLSLRYIAPLDDLEIIEAVTETRCVRCNKGFITKPSLTGKPGGRCACGGWICPVCLGCQPEDVGNLKPCPNQRKRLLKKAASDSKPSIQRRK
jgi:hypothetical protein